MRNRSITFFIILIFPLTISAQSDSAANKPTVSYFNQFTAGGLFGKKAYGNTLTMSGIHGVRFNHIAVGLGLGYDSYMDWNTMPAFASIALDFGTSPSHNILFLQLNSGYTRVWSPRATEGASVREERGRFINPMIGYRIKSGTWRLYILAGYKFQRIKYKVTYPWWWWWSGAPRYDIQQDLERVVVQIGFGIN